MLIQKTAELFGANPRLTRADETLREGEWRFLVSDWTLPQPGCLVDALGQFPSADNVRVSAGINGGSALFLKSRDAEGTAAFLQELGDYREIGAGDTSFELVFQIAKAVQDQTLSLYSFSHFDHGLQKLSASECLTAFAPLCSGDVGLCVLVHEDISPFETDSVAFTTAARPVRTIEREAKITARRDVCHCDGVPDALLPEEFHLKVRSSSNSLNEVLDRMCLITTLGFLCDVSTLTENGKFAFKLNGYRAITGEIQNQKVSCQLVEELYKVYKWAYLDGNLADKLGLARNIISLHWKGDVSNPPEAGIYESVLSGYTIYLKENVDRYISLKKSLCDYLEGFSQKSGKLTDGVGEKLEKNFLGFLGFFISTILLKLVTEKDLAGLFPRPLQIIAWALIAASFVHGCLSLWLSIRERDRVIQDFELLRKRYSDLLHQSDLDQVLDGDQGFQATTKHLDFKLRLFFGGWFLMLVICVITVLQLSWAMPATKRASFGMNSPATPIQGGKSNAPAHTSLAPSIPAAFKKQAPSNRLSTH